MEQKCLVAECDALPLYCKGMCRRHYVVDYRQRARRCKVEGCEDPFIALGFCVKHYQRWKHHGDVERVDRAREGNRLYTLNERYFDEVADEEHAYWLGFLAADGGIIRSTKMNSLRLELAAVDQPHVEAFVAALGSNKPVFRRDRGSPTVGVHLDSWRLLDALERLGIGPRKSETVEPWGGPAELMRHYWRGLFDGDGTIFKVTTRSDWTLGQSGSRACVEGFAEFAREVCGASATPRHVRGGCWTFLVTGLRRPQALARALYGDSTVSLARKRAVAETLMAIDVNARQAQANAKRRATMVDAWATGRHARSRAALT